MVGGEHSRKEPLEQFVNCYSEHLHMSARPVENARDSAINFPDVYSISVWGPGVGLGGNQASKRQEKDMKK
jgi:hypothetical protein